jgi:hypothetical protein
MNEILNSLKSDLLDRRLLPVLVALCLALAGAVAYVVLDGGGSSEAGTTPSAAAGAGGASNQPAVSHGANVAVSEAKADPHTAISETTEGARYRHKPGSHDPFTPLPAPKTASEAIAKSGGSSVSSPSTSSSSTSVEKSSPSSTNTGGSTTTPSTPVKPAPKKQKPKTVYVVSVQFGVMATTPGVVSQLTPYPALKRLQALPSTQETRLTFSGARGNGKGAVFALSREAILKGQGTCIPSAEQCEAIDLEAGQSEELTYLEPDGQSVPYELKVVGITKESTAASAASVRHRRHHHHHG